MMSAPPKDEATLRDLIAYLTRPRRPTFQVRLRPYCPDHGVLMEHGKSPNGLTHYYCPMEGCGQSWRGRVKVV